MFKIIFEIWDFSLEVSLKFFKTCLWEPWNILTLQSSHRWDVCSHYYRSIQCDVLWWDYPLLTRWFSRLVNAALSLLPDDDDDDDGLDEMVGTASGSSLLLVSIFKLLISCAEGSKESSLSKNQNDKHKYPAAILCTSKVFNSCLSCDFLNLLLSHPPRSGVTYVFSSFPPDPSPQQLLPLKSKPVQLNLGYLRQRIYGSGEMYWMTFEGFPWPWPKVMAVAVDLQKFACLRD